MTAPLKLSDIHAGDRLRADEAFSCIDPGHVCEVRSVRGQLYVACCGPEDARTDYASAHLLDGQLNDDGEIVGFERVPA
jgi:hypothetical protein